MYEVDGVALVVGAGYTLLMPVTKIEHFDDAMVRPYRALKDRELTHEYGLFVAEGPYLVERLIESDYEVGSILVSERHAERLVPTFDEGLNVLVVDEALLEEIVGFRFHRGVLAMGVRRATMGLEGLMEKMGRVSTLLICPEVNDPENLGSLFRIAAGFGVEGMLLGERCCDPFRRRCLRVSMGTVLNMPIVQSENVVEDITRLREEAGVVVLGSVLDDGAVRVREVKRGELRREVEGIGGVDRVGLMMGNEADGLGERDLSVVDMKVTIPMRGGTDSLNVSVAGGILLYHLCEYAVE